MSFELKTEMLSILIKELVDAKDASTKSMLLEVELNRLKNENIRLMELVKEDGANLPTKIQDALTKIVFHVTYVTKESTIEHRVKEGLQFYSFDSYYKAEDIGRVITSYDPSDPQAIEIIRFFNLRRPYPENITKYNYDETIEYVNELKVVKNE